MNKIKYDPYYRIAVQGPENQGAILRLMSEMVSRAEPTAFFGAFAYATKKGVQLLCETLEAVSPNWDGSSKIWIVSIDFGHTEPEAITELQGLPNSQVRIPYASEVLRKRLRPKHIFHGKTLICHQGDTLDDGKGGILVASANMTMSGLCFGHEHASAFAWMKRRRVTNSAWNTLDAAIQRLSELFDTCENPTRSFLLDYAARRSMRIRDRSEDSSDEVRKISSSNSDLSLRENAHLATSTTLWIDVDYVVQNRGRGRPGNQIDLQHGTRVFFGIPSVQVPRNTFLGEITVVYRGQKTPCHMRFGNNQMDKLNLPVPEDGGPPEYEGKTLLFKRLSSEKFQLSVRSRATASRCKSKSRSQGTLFKMRSGREYGVFS
jgi:HKD family nuclease